MTTTDAGPGRIRGRGRRPAGAAAAAGLGLGLVLALVLGLAGCGDDGGREDDPEPGPSAGVPEPPEPAGGAPAPPTTFDVDLAVVPGGGVRVRATLRNDGSDELLVVGSPEQAYVTGRGDGVLLSQRVFPWPDAEGVGWAQAPRVEVTRLAAGEELRRDLTVPEPFVRAHPFGADLGDGPVMLPEKPREVTYCLGVIAPPYPPALGLDRRDGTTTVAHGNEAWMVQHQLCSDIVNLG
ncbi:hypothetical protein [Pimelobacter simplex]|uniref:hypothetical protein n=1 Tax=Nocardioides simplex TaxID=2045 RepID=UPI00214F9B0F|nr:hypothetical protein [Pimelobacter simplex]UUW90175.1 hypothetical protein M0M43_01440 [Pimelobacter simplex]UUW94004.1 hypothetical protein M0M48_19950 [Pimelobacter simplex]